MDSRPTHYHFYIHMYHIRCGSDDIKWEIFRQRLSSCIAIICSRLRSEKVAELDAVSTCQPYGNSVAHTSRTNDSNGASPSSSSWTPPTSSNHPPTVGNLATMEGAPKGRQLWQPLPNPAESLDTAIDMHRYTSTLKEYADNHRGSVHYQTSHLSSYPAQWHCAATFGSFTAEGEGCSVKEAKHVASKEICELLGLNVQ
jgi:hypothetical protein